MRHLLTRLWWGIARNGLWQRSRRRDALAWSGALCALLVGCALVAACAPAVAESSHPRASATPLPTTPTAGVASPIAAQLAARAQQAIGSLGQRVEATYDASAEAATVTVTVSGSVPLTDEQIAAAHVLVVQLCYFAEPALWSSGVALREVTLIVLGPMLDEYDDIIMNWSGIAIVKASSAQRIHWKSLSPDAAWNLYDQHILRTSYDIFD
jgi:hypothetical protein